MTSFTNLNAYCREKINHINAALDKFTAISQNQKAEKGFDDLHPQIIFEAMRYSLFAGGKRLRPIMLMAAAETVGGRGLDYLPVACGLEMIHTYSLIHDDLPAMDNDDYRRGKLTNHKIYGDAIAILAGDALHSLAFETMLSQNKTTAKILVKVVKEIAGACGARGMCAGQTADLIAANAKIDADNLKYIHETKTGAMFKASVRAGALLGGANERQLKLLTDYANYFGLAFQITDDILDVIGNEEEMGKPLGSDERNQKSTYVTFYSLDGAKNMANEAVANAENALRGFGEEAQILRDLANYLLLRNS